jgi:hypothetical protein
LEERRGHSSGAKHEETSTSVLAELSPEVGVMLSIPFMIGVGECTEMVELVFVKAFDVGADVGAPWAKPLKVGVAVEAALGILLVKALKVRAELGELPRPLKVGTELFEPFKESTRGGAMLAKSLETSVAEGATVELLEVDPSESTRFKI